MPLFLLRHHILELYSLLSRLFHRRPCSALLACSHLRSHSWYLHSCFSCLSCGTFGNSRSSRGRKLVGPFLDDIETLIERRDRMSTDNFGRPNFETILCFRICSELCRIPYCSKDQKLQHVGEHHEFIAAFRKFRPTRWVERKQNEHG